MLVYRSVMNNGGGNDGGELSLKDHYRYITKNLRGDNISVYTITPLYDRVAINEESYLVIDNNNAVYYIYADFTSLVNLQYDWYNLLYLGASLSDRNITTKAVSDSFPGMLTDASSSNPLTRFWIYKDVIALGDTNGNKTNRIRQGERYIIYNTVQYVK